MHTTREKSLVMLIQRILDGQEWSSETLDRIAQLLMANGYPVREPIDDEPEPTPKGW